MEFTTIKRFAEHNYALLRTDAPKEAAQAVDIIFEFNGQSISNPWIDPSGRFDLTTDEAIDTYGVENVIFFCNSVNEYIKYNTTSRGLERNYQRNRIDIILLAYRNSSKPSEAIKILVDAIGYKTARICVATLVNCVSLSDARIDPRVRSWAQSVSEAPRHSTLWRLTIYGVDSYIHSCHVNQIGEAMMLFEAKRH